MRNIRPIKDKNARPQIEWYTKYPSTNGGAIVHKKEYDMALELYCDKLEKALDKACWCIVNNIDFLANTKKTEEEWHEWFREDWY